MKIHDMKSVWINGVVSNYVVNYFFIKEKNDKNGNPRYKVFIIDPGSPAVYEKMFTTYNLEEAVKTYVERKLWEDVENV